MHSSVTAPIKRIILTNKKNMQVVIANYGARILSIKYLNANGVWIETTLNYQTDAEILADECYMGATCGRVSNRIANAQYMHNGVKYKLEANEGNNMLHGGPGGFSQCIWSVDPVITSADGQSVTLTYLSKDGDQGFPGNLCAKVTYRLSNDDRLSIEYKATSDKNSPINMCNHAYFTLGESSVHNLMLSVNANKYLALNADNIPIGEILATNNEYFSNAPISISQTLKHRDADDCYIIEQTPNQEKLKLACILTSNKSKISLSIFTNQIALQVYSGNYLPIKHGGIALEAQGLVDAVNQVGFETDWVGPSQDYQKVIHYQFRPV